MAAVVAAATAVLVVAVVTVVLAPPAAVAVTEVVEQLVTTPGLAGVMAVEAGVVAAGVSVSSAIREAAGAYVGTGHS